MTLLPSPVGRSCPAGADEGASAATCIAFFEMGEATRIEFQRGFARTLAPTPAPRPGPRWRRGRCKARAPMARKPRLLAPEGEGL
ncbi:hypothetical protein XarbCFBP7409_19250 [Xanthomonas arboricola pv. guizotiae]|uniref:Uncharacterized protein n=1 Tax=Xanthomonas arboricola pv. guizotiae TaxID=487867 RepID=A0A2S6ZQA3_9XANT|nr:hypothetical protein XarbCFBP7409_19250 [Xanthomonas arboricola pv. guizotiae]